MASKFNISPGKSGVLTFSETLYRQTVALKDRQKDAIDKRNQCMVNMQNNPHLDEHDKDAIEKFNVDQLRLTMQRLEKETEVDLETKMQFDYSKVYRITSWNTALELTFGRLRERP
jgi:hypothetical protein